VSSDSVEEKKRSLEEISIEIQELIDDGNDVLVEYEKIMNQLDDLKEKKKK